ncbi:hypothetical protein E8E13_000052, partial [Curvularia kusanoi]
MAWAVILTVALENIALHYSDVEAMTEDEDYPHVSDWIEQIADDGADDEQGFDMSARVRDTRALDMFDAFAGTPRERVQKMQRAIFKHYDIDISDPTWTGRKTIDDTLGDVVKPIYLHCCADG